MTLRKLFYFIALTTFASASFAQGFLKTQGPDIVNERGEKIILRGMGLGGWMLQEGYMLRVQGIGQQQHVIRGKIEELIGPGRTNEFYNAWLANHTRKIDVDSMARWGFNSVRLPMHYNLYTLPVDQEPVKGENTWIEKGFEMTDQLLAWCKANNLYLILDLHGAPGGQGNDLNISDRDPAKPSLWQDEANQKKMIALWRKLAERYANEPWIGAYDIINEPNWGFESADDKNGCGENLNAPLKKLMMEITTAIRAVDQKHIIIIEGNCWGNNYNGILPPWDNNMVLSFHKYWNYNDAESIKRATDFRTQYNVPVWLGESGENSNLWFRDAIHLLESNNIGWAWWPLKKLGNNNPLEVKMPPAYQKVLDYWAGKGTKPSPEEAYGGLMAFAENLKLENTIYHKDVIDAMFRQVKVNDTKPFKTHVAKKGATINAVDYDLGRNGYAYFDKDTANYWVANGGKHTAGNKGNTYRNDGVDIGRNGTDVFIDSFEGGEWLQYTVTSDKAATFTLELQFEGYKGSGKISITANDTALKPIDFPATVPQWKTVSMKGVTLKAGANTLRIKVEAGELKLKSITFR